MQRHYASAKLPAELRAHHGEPGTGHFGLFHGGVWRHSILPRLVTFLAMQSTIASCALRSGHLTLTLVNATSESRPQHPRCLKWKGWARERRL